MTLQELRVFIDGWFCGCGQPDTAAKALRDILALCPLYDHREEFEALVPKHLEYLTLYTLDKFDLIEHGGGIGGAWLTTKGEDVLEALNRETEDGFNRLFVDSCIHGYAVGTEEHCPSGECHW